MFIDVGVQTKLTGQELDTTINNLRREKKILQQKLIRSDNRVNNLEKMLQLLRKNNLIEDVVEDIFKNQFSSSLPFTLFQNEIVNIKNQANDKSYSEEIREFCLTLHFYSP
uniref:THAP9-like helix-turn-helix domain-containing protein n=1 Tax=Schizaphis graminum TaxID=13262 RepID=A0A2S2NCP3_SCHGA